MIEADINNELFTMTDRINKRSSVLDYRSAPHSSHTSSLMTKEKVEREQRAIQFDSLSLPVSSFNSIIPSTIHRLIKRCGRSIIYFA